MFLNTSYRESCIISVKHSLSLQNIFCQTFKTRYSSPLHPPSYTKHTVITNTHTLMLIEHIGLTK